jgi:UDP-N-acetyl-D-glucosamine dehydrogenase
MEQQVLLDKFADKTAVIGVVGLGYVGLPLAVAFAEAGFSVIGVDVAEDKVAKLNAGTSYIIDLSSERLKTIVDNGKFKATTDYQALQEADAVSLCVPTPLRKTKDPDLTYVIQAADSLRESIHAGMLISLESTTYPGTTEEIVVPRVVEQGFTVGEDVFVVFSPERIDPANPVYNVKNIPRVVGGITPACSEIGETYYSQVIDSVVPVSSTTSAEMVKLLENTFRAVNIALANEVAIMCDKLQIDVWEVIQAAATKPFGFMPHYPGPGLGGHCIPLDPHYLSWKLKTLNYNARFIELASEINTSMPLYVIDKVIYALNEHAKAVRGSRVGILGVAYKKNVDDVRESPALDIIELLEQRGADVTWTDPHVEQVMLSNDRLSVGDELTAEWLESLDCVVVVTDHDAFDWKFIAAHSGLVIDTRNAIKKTVPEKVVIGLSMES